MLKLLAFLLVVFLLLPFSGCKAQSHSQKKNDTKEIGKITAACTWDFGKVKEGEVLRHEFIFKNETSKTLIINRVTTSCGCTVSYVLKNKLAPGQDTKIMVKFNTSGYSGETKQRVYVHTNNPRNPLIVFSLKAEIVK